MDIIFVRTRYIYDSYVDYWKLIELSGFPTCYTDEVDISKDVVYIVSPYNGEWVPQIDSQKFSREFKAKLFMLNLERPGGSGSLHKYIEDNRAHIDLGFLDNVFVADKKLSELTGFPYFMLGGHENFCDIEDTYEKNYDLIALCCYSLHRAWMFQTPEMLRPILGGMSIATNAPPTSPVRDALLKTTKAMLNIHQDDFHFCEPLRMIIAVMYGMPIFSEECDNPYNAHTFGEFSEYSHVIKDLLYHNYNRLYDEAIQTRYLFTHEYSFRNCALKAINDAN